MDAASDTTLKAPRRKSRWPCDPSSQQLFPIGEGLQQHYFVGQLCLDSECVVVEESRDEGAVRVSTAGFFGRVITDHGSQPEAEMRLAVLHDIDPVLVNAGGDPAVDLQPDAPSADEKDVSSDDDDDDCATTAFNWSTWKERGTLQKVSLTYCEALFLSYALGCLGVLHGHPGNMMNLDEMWLTFRRQRHFHIRYAVYHHFRSKKWVVKDGIKFGCDFLLYKIGPPFFHASYSVKILFGSGNEERMTEKWRDIALLNRVTEAAAKELLLVQVGFNEDADTLGAFMDSVVVSEMLFKRWIPSQHRQ